MELGSQEAACAILEYLEKSNNVILQLNQIDKAIIKRNANKKPVSDFMPGTHVGEFNIILVQSDLAKDGRIIIHLSKNDYIKYKDSFTDFQNKHNNNGKTK